MTRRERRALQASRAVAYIRVSTDEQALGPVAQRDAIGRWAKARGVTIVAVHEDLGVSGGAKLDECPGLMAAVAALKTQPAGLLVVAKRDRLARDVMKAGMIEALVERQGATVVSAAGEGEGNDPTAKLMRTIVDAFAEYERALIGARTKAGLAVKKARGERVGGVPFGWRDVDGRLQEDEREQAIIRYAHEQRREGLTISAVVESLTRRGFKPRSGGRWHATQVARMLQGAPA